MSKYMYFLDIVIMQKISNTSCYYSGQVLNALEFKD